MNFNERNLAMKKHQVLIDPSKCTGCGLCVKTCVAHNIELENKKAKTLLKNCLMCGQCTAVCPGKAVTISGYDAEEIKEKMKTGLNPQEMCIRDRYRKGIHDRNHNGACNRIIN